MKRILVSLILILILFCSYCSATEKVYIINADGTVVSNPTQLHTEQDSWYLLGAFTTATTTPDVNHRTIATIILDSNNADYNIPDKWNGIRLRCKSIKDISDANAITTVVDLFLANGVDDSYNRISTLTFISGTQFAADSNYVFATTLVESNFNWIGAADPNYVRLISPGTSYIAEYFFDARGSKKIAVCPTTITNGRAAKIEITGW